MSETLTQFGTSFQSKIIASLLREMKFIQTINDILSPDMFDSELACPILQPGPPPA